MFKKIILYFVLWKIITITFAYAATFILPFVDTYTLTRWDISVKKLPYLLWVWGNFDGVHYLDIAKNSYHSANHAFFPLFPLLIRFFYDPISRFFVSPYVVSGLLVSNVAFLLSLIVLYKTLLLDGKSKIIPLFFLVVILFPTSSFYGAIYNDSLFLFLASLTIYNARKNKFVPASIFGFLATLTRFNGLTLFFIVLFEYIASQTKDDNLWNMKKLIKGLKHSLSFGRILKDKMYAIFLIPLAFLGYLFYTHINYGSWQLVVGSLKQWDQDRIVLPVQVLFRYFKIIFLSLVNYIPLNITFYVAVFELFSVFFYILLMVYSFKKIRLSYWVFFVVSILIPSLTGTFQGMPRYGLHLYPMFLSLTLFLSGKPTVIKVAYLVFSILLMLFTIALFTRGYFVA